MSTYYFACFINF